MNARGIWSQTKVFAILEKATLVQDTTVTRDRPLRRTRIVGPSRCGGVMCVSRHTTGSTELERWAAASGFSCFRSAKQCKGAIA